MENKDDGELMKLVALGNKKAFQEVYHRYSRLVFGYGARILKDKSAAEDTAQEVWVRVVRMASSYRGESSLKNWLMKVTRNTALTQIRKRGLVAEVTEDQQSSDQVSPDIFEQDILRSIELKRLSELINELPDPQRVALMLWISEKLSYDEIASEMGTSESAVKSLIFRARRTLQERGVA